MTRYQHGIVTVILFALLCSAGRTANAAPERPDLPSVELIDADGEVLQGGVLDFYYWETGGHTYKWYGGALKKDGSIKPGFKVPWPPAVLIDRDDGIRIRVGRVSYPTAGLTFWGVEEVGGRHLAARGPRTRFHCYPEDAPSSCHFEPQLLPGGGIAWDVVAAVPSNTKELFLNFQPSWWNFEEGEPTKLQEAAWDLQVIIK